MEAPRDARHICLHDKDQIWSFLQQDPYLHIYSIADLDEFFWPYTTWYGLGSVSGTGAVRALEAVALVYSGMELPTLLVLNREVQPAVQLIGAIAQLLPGRFAAHVSPGVEQAFAGTHEVESCGTHLKMALRDTQATETWDTSSVVALRAGDLPQIWKLYEASYSENWFDPRMLETGKYYGEWEGECLVSIAGVHAYSPRYKVAALGNIATLPSYRGRGYAGRVTARLCQALSAEGVTVGLNVKADNAAAIACYRGLGFELVAHYHELNCRPLSPSGP